MENIIFAAEDLFGHVLESHRGVLLISCFDGNINDLKKRYMTVIGKESGGDVVFKNERMNLDLGQAVADFYRRSGANTDYTPLNNISSLLEQYSSANEELIRIPSRKNRNVCVLPVALNDNAPI